jgi:hypothetical protein
MSNHDQVRALIIQFSGQANTITVPRLYALMMGSLDGGAFLNQLIFWSDKGDDGWFWKSDGDFANDICVTPYSIRKSRDACIKAGFLETKIAKVGGAPTLHYYFLLDTFIEALKHYVTQMDFAKSKNPFCEIEKSYNTEDNLNKREAVSNKTAAQPELFNDDNSLLAESSKEPARKERGEGEPKKKPTMRKPRPRNEMWDAVVAVTKMSPQTSATRIGKIVKQLSAAGVDPALILRAYSPGGWWYEVRCKGMDSIPVPSDQGILRTWTLAQEYYETGGLRDPDAGSGEELKGV